MKKIITAIIILMSIMLPNNIVHAKSYTIEEVNIRGMVYPDGSILMNEIFTYTLDGSFSEFTRSFPAKHNGQINAFEAYVINEENPVAGEITQEMLQPLYVTEEGTTRTVSVKAKDTKISIFYMYVMKDVIKSYDTYSDIDITFFEKGSNHKTDFKNVKILYVFPGDIGNDKIHGFMHDRHAEQPEVYRDGITFLSSKSEAHTNTSTRVLFPSTIMTEQQKGKAPIPLNKVIAEEEKLSKMMNSKLSFIPLIKNGALTIGMLFLVLGIIISFLFRQRVFSLGGNPDLVLQTDPVYLFFIDRNGEYHPKSFLSGLFSITEKGYTDVRMEPAAERLKEQSTVQKRTLSFYLNKHQNKLLPFEKNLISWFFNIGLSAENRKFHLHDIAGATVKEKKSKKTMKAFDRKQYDFEANHWRWNREVKKLMNEAGTFSDKIPKIIKGAIIILLPILLVTAYISDLKSGWDLVTPLIVYIIIAAYIFRGYGFFATIFFFGYSIFMSIRIVEGKLGGAMVFMILMGALLYYVSPTSIITSMNGLRTKLGIMKFRSRIKNGLPPNLTVEEQERWLARVYLLNKSKSQLPKMKTPLPESLRLAPMFEIGVDPLHFVMNTWGPLNFPIDTTPRSTGGSNDSGGGSVGGGSSGGGGAGVN